MLVDCLEAIQQEMVDDAKGASTYGKALTWLTAARPDWINESGGQGRLIDQVVAYAFEKAYSQINREAKDQEIPQ
jgi:hypothetical protein